MNIKKFTITLVALLPLLSVITTFSPQAANASIDYNRLIDNSKFEAQTMTASQINAFLNAFPDSCISPDNNFTTPEPTGVDGTSYHYGSKKTAGRAIYNAAHAYGLNPQVLLATLQKEQSLPTGSVGCHPNTPNPNNSSKCDLWGNGVTHNCTDACPWSYGGGCIPIAVGYNCPGRCDADTEGFSKQITLAAWKLKYVQERSEGHINWAINSGNWHDSWGIDRKYVGPMTQGYHQRCSSCANKYYDGYYTLAKSDGHTVHLTNGATAALYRYTPFYSGNSRFVQIFTGWFGSTRNSILFRIKGSTTYYLEWAGYYYPVPSLAMLRAYGLAGIAPRLVSAPPTGETRGPLLSRSAKFGSENPSDPDYTATINLVEGGRRHGAPNWSTLNNYGVSSYTDFPTSLSWLLKNGDPLRLVVRQPNGAIYLIENDKKRGFPDWNTFSTLSGPNYAGNNQVYSEQSLTNVTASFLDAINVGAPMLLNGEFIKPAGSLSIYLYENGKKLPFSPSHYAAWGQRLDHTIAKAAINQIPSGPGVPILVRSTSGTKYLADNGKKKVFSASMEAAWGLNDIQFTQMTDRALSKLHNASVSSLITAGSGVYSVSGGQRHGVASLKDFNKLGFSWTDVDKVNDSALSLLPQGANLYAPGSLVRKPNGAVYIIDSDYKALGITSGALFGRFDFDWGDVRNASSAAINGYATSHLHTLLKNSSNGNYNEIDKGVRHYIDSDAFSAGQYDMSGWVFNEVDPEVLRAISPGRPLTRFIRGSGTTVYYVENGKKHGITTATKFRGLGGSWNKVTNVSDEFLSEIPSGTII